MQTSKKIAVIALMSATLTGGKMAMSFIPNVEPVSILLALYAYVFGIFYALPCAIVFVTTETFIWGVNTWVISYFIYWPLLAIVFSLLGKRKAKLWQTILTAVLMTLLFGVLTSLVDVGLFMGRFDNFWARFATMYARGILFFAIHVMSNCVIFAAAFNPLKKILSKLKQNLFPDDMFEVKTKDN